MFLSVALFGWYEFIFSNVTVGHFGVNAYIFQLISSSVIFASFSYVVYLAITKNEREPCDNSSNYEPTNIPLNQNEVPWLNDDGQDVNSSGW